MRRPHLPGSAALLAVAVVLAVSACGGSSSPKASVPHRTQAAAPTLALPTPASFGAYETVPLAGSTPYAGPATPHSLVHVALTAHQGSELKQVKALGPALENNGFAVVRSGSTLFQQEYEGNIYGGYPIYVTTDAAYNAWHLVFDKTLRDLEQQVLLPKLEQLVTRAQATARRTAKALAGSSVAAAATHAEQLYEVAAAELGSKVTLGPLAVKEKALVDAHAARAVSPITGASIDYSLFIPRGHYNLTPALTRFFRAMSVLGQLAFCLPGTQGCRGVEPARVGIVAASMITADPATDALWHQIYDPTSFLVGLADDYTPDEVETALHKAAPSAKALAALSTDAAVKRVVASLVAARRVRIDPRSASIRIMGTRFVLDSYLLDQLIYPHVGTATKPRALPSALDVASAFGFGSKVSATALAAEKKSQYANYASQLKLVSATLAGRPAKAWGSTVYDAWLYALEPVFKPHGAAFPDYMRTPIWAAKDLQSGLGSYTELKHDTILFVKQPVAEAGGDPVVQTPLNWVEPDPAVFGRLAAVTDLMRTGLASRGLLTKEAGGLLGTDADLFRFLDRVATGELAGKPLAKADNTRLRGVGDLLASIWFRTAVRGAQAPPIPDESLVADIASAPNGVLEEGIGNIDTIYVVVPGAKQGTFELARGGVYSYYEFTNPPADRLTDTEWRTMVESGKVPARPAWESVFRVPCPPPPKSLAKYNPGCSPTDTPG
ncbi:MAG TPA: DUF3160 domain-containing protein [Gaiellaceae bacterium]